MENVPVKIAENYKPPPRVYQVPQSIANKLQLPAAYYNEAPQFTYDFQLERKVRSKVPEWQRMRRMERDARRERKEKREQQRLRDVEAQHKQLLGAVSYPSAAELSSSSDDEESEAEKKTISAATQLKVERDALTKAAAPTAATQTSSFHNILQPTIVTRSSGSAAVASVWNGPLNALTLTDRKNCDDSSILSTAKHSNVFNYKDFEDDTSSPFDNIELKTINDLDILAQVLHNTQLKARADQLEAEREQQQAKENTNEKEEDQTKQLDASNTNGIKPETNESNLMIIENTRAALDRVDFSDLNEQLQPQNETNNIPTNNSNKYACPTYTPTYSNQLQQQPQPQQLPAFISYNQQYSNYNMLQPQQPTIASATFTNQNYLYTGHCNGISAGSPALYYSPTHAAAAAAYSNANTYLSPNQNFTIAPTAAQLLSEAELKSKSKSVPDIIRELSVEVRNAEMRRSRNYSHNLDDGRTEEDEKKAAAVKQQQHTPVKVTPTKPQQYYAQLEATAQMLSKKISHMGFPLERVAKIAQMFGADDKKIIEHLIPLSELMDLGFDEAKISEALMKFDNNKEKALEYLIS